MQRASNSNFDNLLLRVENWHPEIYLKEECYSRVYGCKGSHPYNNSLPHGRQTLRIECKGVLFNGVQKLLFGNRVGVGLTWTTIRPLLPS